MPPPNALPKAVDDSFSTPSAVALSGSVAGNDTPSQDGGNLWAVVTPPAHGSLSFQPDGSFTYVPEPGYVGPDSFTYRLKDGDGDTSTATVALTVVAKATEPPAPEPPAPEPPTPEPPAPEPPTPEPPTPELPAPGLPVPETPPLPPASLEPPPLSLLPAESGMPLAAPQLGEQVRDQSVWFDGAVFTRMPRLPLPLHPVLYVTRTVAGMQAERAGKEAQAQGCGTEMQPRLDLSHVPSLGSGLGFDPALFVQEAVRLSQQSAHQRSASLTLRPSVVRLSSDERLPAPTLIAPEDEAPFAPQKPDASAGTPDAAAPSPEGGARPGKSPAAHAFSEQLQRARRPLATARAS